MFTSCGARLVYCSPNGLSGASCSSTPASPLLPLRGGAAVPTSPVPPVASRQFELAAVLSALDGTSTTASPGQGLAGFAVTSSRSPACSTCGKARVIFLCWQSSTKLDQSPQLAKLCLAAKLLANFHQARRLDKPPAKTTQEPRGPEISGILQHKRAGSVQTGPGRWLGVVGRIPAAAGQSAGWGTSAADQQQFGASIGHGPRLFDTLPASPRLRGLGFRGRLPLGCSAAQRAGMRAQGEPGKGSFLRPPSPQPPCQACQACQRLTKPAQTSARGQVPPHASPSGQQEPLSSDECDEAARKTEKGPRLSTVQHAIVCCHGNLPPVGTGESGPPAEPRPPGAGHMRAV